jgi:hypothetical protein
MKLYDVNIMYHHETEITLGLIRSIALQGTTEERLGRLFAVLDRTTTAMRTLMEQEQKQQSLPL